MPFFPLGGFIAAAVRGARRRRRPAGRDAAQVALAWLLQRSPTILLIPGTSSVAHLRENVAAANLELPLDAVPELDAIGAATAARGHEAV